MSFRMNIPCRNKGNQQISTEDTSNLLSNNDELPTNQTNKDISDTNFLDSDRPEINSSKSIALRTENNDLKEAFTEKDTKEKLDDKNPVVKDDSDLLETTEQWELLKEQHKQWVQEQDRQEQGEQCIKSEQGKQGIQGEKGEQGEQGEQGEK